MQEIKSGTHFTKGIDGRSVTGIAAVFGNIDHGNDRLWAGSFAKTLQERLPKMKFLWNHGSDGWDFFCTPPIARIDAAYEVGRDALPAKLLAFAPEATGGVEVKRTYLDTERGNELLAAYQAGIEMEMSFAFDSIRYDFSTVGDARVRELREVRNYDFSDVNMGMNEATTGAKHDAGALLVKRCETLVHQFQSGKTDFAAHLRKLRALLAPLALEETEQPKAEPMRRAESFDWKTSLTQRAAELQELLLTVEV